MWDLYVLYSEPYRHFSLTFFGAILLSRVHGSNQIDEAKSKGAYLYFIENGGGKDMKVPQLWPKNHPFIYENDACPYYLTPLLDISKTQNFI